MSNANYNFFGPAIFACVVSSVLATTAYSAHFKTSKLKGDNVDNSLFTEETDAANEHQLHLSKKPSQAEMKELSDKGKVYKFVLTGGPCSGKTTSIARLQVFLNERGFRVFIAQEAATILLLNGASFDDFGKPGCPYAFQQFVIRNQLTLENTLENYAKATQQKSVLLCDRGIMDGSAYVSKEEWNKLLHEEGLNHLSANVERYNAVFHLVTAADGASQHYTLENNKARSESADEAIKVDRKTQAAWVGHPRHIIIDNSADSFDKKIESLVASLANFVGLPSLSRRAHKFPILEPVSVHRMRSLGLEVQEFDVEKIILAPQDEDEYGSTLDSDSGLAAGGAVTAPYVPPPTRSAAKTGGREKYRFVRKRSQGAFSTYGLTIVKELEDQQTVELKQVISSKMYNLLASNADKTRDVVKQKRYCFLWRQQSFHIYEYKSHKPGLSVLLCQSEGNPDLPPFLSVGPEIEDGNEDYSTYRISQK